MRKRKLTRMERTIRKQRFLSVVGVSVATMFLVAVTPEKQPEPLEMPEIVYLAPAVVEEELPVAEEPPVEEFSPVREDIPLDEDTQVLLYSACEEFGIPYELALAVVWRETNFRNVVGDNGASVGYMQIQERYHKDRMNELGVVALNDPHGNFRVGCSYLAELIERYDNVEMALMSYNAGPNGAKKYWFSNGVYSNQYSQAVLGYMEGLASGDN